MSKMKSFVKQFAALVTGDSATVQAEKNFRRAESALKTQIAKLEGETITKEDALETAKEHATAVLVNNGKPITDQYRTDYVANLVDADNAVKSAQKELDEHKNMIKFLQGKLAELNEEVDA